MTKPIRIVALLCCHNRRSKTERCLAALADQALVDGVSVSVIACDDGSVDGTGDMLRGSGRCDVVLNGDGNLYWCGGMRVAFARALEGDYDFYLWLNDDVRLFSRALALLLKTHARIAGAEGAATVVMGAVCDSTGKTTYSGLRRGRGVGGRLRLRHVEPSGDPEVVDTFNGNCVLIPRLVAKMVGNLDASFQHALGDLDYGYRAARSGCRLVLAAEFVGECAENANTKPWMDVKVPLRDAWRLLVGPKGLPPKSWLVFCWRYCGLLWPAYFAGPYVRFCAKRVRVAFRASHVEAPDD